MSGPGGGSGLPDTGLAASSRQPLDRLGGGFMRSREVVAAGEAAGYRGWQFYAAGRLGVLGDVDAGVVIAAAAFFAPGLLRRAWDGARAVEPREDSVRRYAAAAHAWADRRLAGFDSAARLAELLEPVVAEADVALAPLFAGWRAVPLPDDPAARAVQLCHLLREHRGALHAVAVLAEGLTPLQAILTGPHGADGARYFGWRGSLPDCGPAQREARERAEARTDELAGRCWGVLGQAAEEAASLLQAAQRHLASTR